MTQTDLRPRSASDILDAAFVLYRRNPGPFLMLNAIAAVPGLILNIIALGRAQVEFDGDLFRFVPALLVGIVTFAWSGGVVQRLGAQAFLGEEMDIAHTVRDITRRMPALLGATVLLLVVLTFGLVLLIAPGVYCIARWFAVPSVVAIEKSSAVHAFKRASQLTAGHAGHVLATLLLAYVILIVLNGGVLIVSRALPTTILPLIVTSAFGIVLQPVVTLTAMLLYFDLRIRNEGFDVEHMANTLDAADGRALSSPAY